MTPGDKSYMYNPILICRCVREWPFWRKILARYFEKYKLTSKEYENWYINNLIK